VAEFVVNPNDIAKAWQAAQTIGSPGALVKRLAGLGQDEQRAGVPTWAWVALAFGVGAAVGIATRPRVADFLRNAGLSE